ncbi:uncharacterized protein LOC111906533 [Lactuca sativa]|uniref:uncharacterized protein LOC111906533 n=1 Tax=Lactuca sativa TaxID=4236 RepID=UPI000CAC5B81|nr:uncharacterized protein LOC111906533 [Lactuca sativa]XP_052620104.1 uncharacterized protein LOC111906533 [Lactuca sativa]
MASTNAAAREHVDEIRRRKFSIGGEPNPLTEDLHQAVKNLSAELYAKDVHFLMELIQNAEDNEYPEGVDPSLEFVITSKDITNTGAPATLLVFNNEKGFSDKNIESICSVGRSTKKDLRKRGYIGEKGIGFKSVFLITAQPYIFSNGYQIRFNEKPCEHCNVGYIVPEWVEEDPTLSAIQSVYGSATSLPTTTLVLPLKPEKVKPVKDQLSSVHPEVLLFLSKIRRLSVRKGNEDPRLDTVNAISISSEKNFFTSKSMDAVSYTVHLTADADDSDDEDETECGYYMWKQRFPVKQENKVDVRMEVEEWTITLAFPIGERLSRGSTLPGIYSFLPTETITNFPFIIQADFLLASSRENILWDNKWNKGILDCVPLAFLNAFTSLVKSTENAPVSSLPFMFRFLPVYESSHPKLNHVRDAIKAKLMNEAIVPCESHTEQKLFCKPNEVGRLKPAFWSILKKARRQGVSFSNISSHGAYLLASSFDKSDYNVILDFLEIKPVSHEWYAKCIGSSNLVMGVSEDVYIQLLLFIAGSWGSCFYKTNMKNTPLIKYIGRDGKVDVITLVSGTNKLLAADSDSDDSDDFSWLINWNTEFQCSLGKFFLPKVTQEAMQSCSKKTTLVKWLKEKVKVEFVSVCEYAELLGPSLKSNSKLAVIYAHFLHNSLQKDYLRMYEVQNLCCDMPIVDNYGQVTREHREVLVPANGSKWVELIGSNPWRQHNYVELGEDYTRSMTHFGDVTSGKELVLFLQKYVEASDVPNLSPPNAAIPTLSSPLTKKNTFLLLKWLRNLRLSEVSLPKRFLSSIKNGSWLKVSLNGSPGYRPPSESFMLDSTKGSLLQNGSVLVDIPLVDEKYYGVTMKKYKDELETIGVRFQDSDACKFIGKRLMDLATSSQLTKDNVLSILKFIEYLGKHSIPCGEFIKVIREKEWLRTTRGDKTPSKSVLFSQDWNAASQISDIPFLDQDYYDTEILSYKNELNLLGVVMNFDNSYQLVLDNLKSSSSLTCLSPEAMLLILRCIQNLQSSDKLVQAIKNNKCLKTNLGYRCPSECFLSNPESEWGCLLKVFGSFPVLDEKFYGRSIFSMSNELKKIGVMVDFEDASKEFSRTFKQQASLSSIKKEHVLSFVQCYGKLMKLEIKFSSDFKKCIREEKWIRTRLGGYRPPKECILFGAEWEPISTISLLPFIDDNFYGNEIHNYRADLKGLGVITDFKDGAKFVANGLFLPQDCSSLTPANVYALLDSVKKLKEESGTDLPSEFLDKVSQKNWLKTYFGYKRPDECLLFDSSWDSLLKRKDGPFIDEGFYGTRIGSYRKELNVLGVITDSNKECQLLAGYLECHSNFETIGRIYNYLSTFKWEPVDEDSKRIWIPRGTDNGEWVLPQDCVLHDKNNLFGEQLNVLENCKYDGKILDLFANTLNVKVHPSIDDYCKLWKAWESSGSQIVTHKECCAFWEFVVRNWNPRTEDTFKNNLSKLPVLDPASNVIFLFDKCDVFIGDDLFLTDLFTKTFSRPIFVWFPQPSQKTLTRTKLVDIYTKLGVRILSESAQKNISDIDHAGFEPVNLKEKINKKGLFKLILAFLADPNLKIEPDKRHEAVSRVLAIEAFETPEKMSVRYSLTFSCGEVVDVEPRRMIRWDKQLSKLYMQKMERASGHKNVIEYASHFAEEIAEGVLWDNEELVPDLCELIRLGFLLEFDEEAVEFLMKIKNLQIFLEDQDFLSSTFS